MADQSVLTVSIVTPDGEVYDRKNATIVILNTKSGQLGIMPNHVPVIASLQVSEVKIGFGSHKDKVAVNGGFVEFSNDVVTIVANSAEKKNDIDVQRAEKARDRAKIAVKQAKRSHDRVALQKDQLALERAVNRIQTAKQ